jgi:hypothetical protein
MLSALLFAALLTSPADAGVVVRVGVPGVRVEINPWGPYYRPAARAGFVWIAGHYERDGDFIPGRWVPSYTRAGYAWVDGYWNGRVWVDGYWRAAARPGYAWFDGYYAHGRWVAGYWGAPRVVHYVPAHSRYVAHVASAEHREQEHHEARESHESRGDSHSESSGGTRGAHVEADTHHVRH